QDTALHGDASAVVLGHDRGAGAAGLRDRSGDHHIHPPGAQGGGERAQSVGLDAVVVGHQHPGHASSSLSASAASPSGLTTALAPESSVTGRTRTRARSSAIASASPVPNPCLVTLSAPAAAPRLTASRVLSPRTSPATTPAVSESPAPWLSATSSCGGVTSSRPPSSSISRGCS